MKKYLIVILSVVLLIALAGCGSNKKETTTNKLIPQKDVVEVPAPDAMQYYKDAQSKEIKPGDKTYKAVLEYLGTQFSQNKMKLSTIDLKSTDFQDQIAKEQSLLLNYKSVEKVSVNFDQGKKDLQVSGIAIILSGKYKGYLATLEEKSTPVYEKIDITDDFMKNFK